MTAGPRPCAREAEELSALVDGELGHAERERAQVHLAHCPGCRAEVESLRALRARLDRAALGTPAPPAALLAGLVAMGAGLEPADARAVSPAAGRPRAGVAATAPSGRADASRPGRGTRRGRALRRRVAGGAAVLGVLGGLFVLGGRPTDAPAPVDPGGDRFVTEFVDVPGEQPLGTVPVVADLVP